MPLQGHGLSGDRASSSCVGPARALLRATNARGRDELVAPAAAFADPPNGAEMNAQLCVPGGRAYLASYVRR